MRTVGVDGIEGRGEGEPSGLRSRLDFRREVDRIQLPSPDILVADSAQGERLCGRRKGEVAWTGVAW